MSLPSPRTREQAMRDLITNAIHLMSDEQLAMFYGEAGPYCMEVLLDKTAPGAGSAAEPEPEPKSRQVRYAPDDEARELAARLRGALGDDMSADAVLEVIGRRRGAREMADAIANGEQDLRLTEKAAAAIREFLQ